MIVLLFLESTDILFAVDSVPAVFAVTREPFIMYTSNVFAILGLRALYFLLAGALDRFYALKYGLAAVLVFVGLKMVWLDHVSGGRFPIGVSLVVIAGVITTAILFSLVFPKAAGQGVLRWNASHKWIILHLAGAVCLLLSVAGLLFAAGPARKLFPLAALSQVPDEFLYQSAGCYAFCGALLVRAAAVQKRQQLSQTGREVVPKRPEVSGFQSR
jgi:hypothetical protein